MSITGGNTFLNCEGNMPKILTTQVCSIPPVSSRASKLLSHGAISIINFRDQSAKEVAYGPRQRLGRRPSMPGKNISPHTKHARCSRALLGSFSGIHSITSSSGSEIWKGLAHDSRTVQEPIRTLLLDNYDSYTYNLFQLLSIINGAAPVVLRNDEIEWDELCHLLYKERAFHNVVISPGPGSPTCAQDVGICLRLLQECYDIPILGVCLGHQALGYVHGAQILHAPETVHGRLSEIEHIGHPLFASIPSGLHSGFKVVRYHSLVVDAATLPQDLVPTAWTVLKSGLLGPELLCRNPNEILRNGQLQLQGGGDWNYSNGHPTGVSNVLPGFNATDEVAAGAVSKKHATKVLMGLSHRRWPHHGVQFHPESVATRYGKEILVNFRNMTVKFWEDQLWRPGTTVTSTLRGKRLENSRPLDAGLFQTPAHHKNAPASEWHVPLLRAVDPSLSAQANSSAVQASNTHAQSCFGAENKGHGSKADMKTGDSIWEGEHLRLHHQKLPKLVSKAGGSRTLFCKLFAEEAVEDTFWLDSSSREQGRARFSFMGGRGGSLWRRITYRIANDMVDMCGGVLKFQNAAGHVKETVVQGGFLDFLNRELELRQCRKEDYASLPFDFCGGFIGYLGYELKEECGATSNRHKSPMPDAGMFLADRMVVVDHDSDDVYVLALYQAGSPFSSSPDDPFSPGNSACSSSCDEIVTVCGIDKRREEKFLRSESLLGTSFRVQAAGSSTTEQMRSARLKDRFEKRAAEAWVGKIVGEVRSLAQQQQHQHQEVPQETLKEGMHRVNLVSSVHKMTDEVIRPPFVAETSRSGYIKDVRRCQELIKDGESYEICLTTRLRRKVTAAAAMDGLGLYLTLRETNPAPYSSWLHFGEDGPCICSSSPERFLQLDGRGVLEAKPIKGTAARGKNPIEDEKLKSELQLSEKDQAENLMIVDLLRNDLGRVCEPGTVHVPSLMSVESYSTVHTMVSTVRGQKRPDMTAVDCVRAAFPGGSMTGAPKLRTMEIIDSLEKSPRGVYSGSIGYFSFNSSFDLNIVIRTLVIHEGEASLGAGGAVIALSDPDSEYEEMLLKTKAPIRAVGRYESDCKVPTSNPSEQRGPLLPLGF